MSTYSTAEGRFDPSSFDTNKATTAIFKAEAKKLGVRVKDKDYMAKTGRSLPRISASKEAN